MMNTGEGLSILQSNMVGIFRFSLFLDALQSVVNG
jgi:hypothetical protein